MKTSELFIHEEVLLLALGDQKGTTITAWPQLAMGGAILAELLLREWIVIEEVGKKKFVKLLKSDSLNNEVLDECIDKIKNAKRRAQVQGWVSRFSNIRRLHHRVAEELCRKGVLREDIGKVLFIFSRKIYPELNPKPEREMIERLRKAIFTQSREVDSRTVILVSLTNSTGILNVIFDKKKLKEQKTRIKQLGEGEVIGKATQQAIEAIQAIIVMTAVMPAIISTGH